jgi:hypothetical protein
LPQLLWEDVALRIKELFQPRFDGLVRFEKLLRRGEFALAGFFQIPALLFIKTKGQNSPDPFEGIGPRSHVADGLFEPDPMFQRGLSALRHLRTPELF